jgi:hypothetical protein
MIEPETIPREFSTCRMARQNPQLFALLVGEYSEIVQLAVKQSASRTDQHVFPRVRSLARRAGVESGEPQDLIGVHLAALAILVKNRPHALVKACIRHSRLLLVRMIGDLALYYRDQALPAKGTAQ